MSKEIKKYWDMVPNWVKVLLLLLVGYNLYKNLTAAWAQKKELDAANDTTNGYNNSQVISASGQAVNIQALVVEVWNEMYIPYFESEAKIIEILHSVGVQNFKEFNRRFNTYLVTNKKNWPHKPVFGILDFGEYHNSLQDACSYFLEGKYKEVSYLFKAL